MYVYSSPSRGELKDERGWGASMYVRYMLNSPPPHQAGSRCYCSFQNLSFFLRRERGWFVHVDIDHEACMYGSISVTPSCNSPTHFFCSSFYPFNQLILSFCPLDACVSLFPPFFVCFSILSFANNSIKSIKGSDK